MLLSSADEDHDGDESSKKQQQNSQVDLGQKYFLIQMFNNSYVVNG